MNPALLKIIAFPVRPQTTELMTVALILVTAMMATMIRGQHCVLIAIILGILLSLNKIAIVKHAQMVLLIIARVA